MRLSPGTMRHSIGDLLTTALGDAERVEYLIYTACSAFAPNVLAVIVFGSILLALSWQLDRLRADHRANPCIRQPEAGAEDPAALARRPARRSGWTSLAESGSAQPRPCKSSIAAEFETAAFAATLCRRAARRNSEPFPYSLVVGDDRSGRRDWRTLRESSSGPWESKTAAVTVGR
jgi:hypothetical protein